MALWKDYQGSGLASPVSKPQPIRKPVEEVKTPCRQATALKHHSSREDLCQGIGQDTN